jgi:succinyl-CoA synthetase beta subunit
MVAPMEIIEEALEAGKLILNEHDSGRFLSSFGIPFPLEAVAPNTEKAVLAANEIGFPVVLKALGESLTHKTDIGGVALNLRSRDEVIEESVRLLNIIGCEGLLIQEYIKGHRELTCGLTRDVQFGPCVMFGLGGVLTEVLSDVVFRIAPLSSWDAQEMLEEIRCKSVFDTFRGEAPIDRSLIIKILLALGEIGAEYDDVKEIDINPLLVQPNGEPLAVDALVVLQHDRGTIS